MSIQPRRNQTTGVPSPRATVGAVKAVAFLVVIFAILCVVLVALLRRTAPCHATTVENLPSADGAYIARKVEVVCNKRHADESGVEIAIAESNNAEGKSRQFANVYAVAGLRASAVTISWASARELRITAPPQHGAVTAQQPQFKDVKITYAQPMQ